MTLADLMRQANAIGFRFSTCEIPLQYEGRDVEIELVTTGSNKEGWVINLNIEQK